MTATHSVIVPTLNCAPFIAEALNSALAQLGPEDEVIVADNGSTDDTIAVVEAIAADRRVIVLREAKRGPAAARNTGMRAARGRYISFLDGDDYWPEGRLDRMMQVLDAAPEADAVFGRVRVQFDSSLGDRLPAEQAVYGVLDGIHAPLIGLWNYVFKREILERCGVQNEEMLAGEDVDYILRLRAAGLNCAVYDGTAIVYRRHGANITRDPKTIERANMRIIASHVRRKRPQT